MFALEAASRSRGQPTEISTYIQQHRCTNGCSGLIVEDNDDDVQREVNNMAGVLTAKRVHLSSNGQATEAAASIPGHISRVRSRRDGEPWR